MVNVSHDQHYRTPQRPLTSPAETLYMFCVSVTTIHVSAATSTSLTRSHRPADVTGSPSWSPPPCSTRCHCINSFSFACFRLFDSHFFSRLVANALVVLVVFVVVHWKKMVHPALPPSRTYCSMQYGLVSHLPPHFHRLFFDYVVFFLVVVVVPLLFSLSTFRSCVDTFIFLFFA